MWHLQQFHTCRLAQLTGMPTSEQAHHMLLHCISIKHHKHGLHSHQYSPIPTWLCSACLITWQSPKTDPSSLLNETSDQQQLAHCVTVHICLVRLRLMVGWPSVKYLLHFWSLSPQRTVLVWMTNCYTLILWRNLKKFKLTDTTVDGQSYSFWWMHKEASLTLTQVLT